MSKTVKFEGYVNGQKYENVDDYNKAITEAIESGNLRSASSSTTMCEEFHCNCQDIQQHPTAAPDDVQAGPAQIPSADQIFNSLVGADEDAFEESMQDIHDVLQKEDDENRDKFFDNLYEVYDMAIENRDALALKLDGMEQRMENLKNDIERYTAMLENRAARNNWMTVNDTRLSNMELLKELDKAYATTEEKWQRMNDLANKLDDLIDEFGETEEDDDECQCTQATTLVGDGEHALDEMFEHPIKTLHDWVKAIFGD